MSENLSYDHKLREVITWARMNTENVAVELNKQYGHTLSRTGLIDMCFLSELGLCKAITNIDLPNGFSVPSSGFVDVYSSIYSEKYLTSVSHYFATCDDLLLCITTGQFFKLQHPSEFTTKGQAIEKYVNIAPDLFTFDRCMGVAILHGRSDEVFDRLHLKYRF
jgi:hypothetical protein